MFRHNNTSIAKEILVPKEIKHLSFVNVLSMAEILSVMFEFFS